MGTRWTYFVKRSTNVKTASFLSGVCGKPIIKSMLILCQGCSGTGSGCSRPTLFREDLLRWHNSQVFTNSFTDLHRPSHMRPIEVPRQVAQCSVSARMAWKGTVVIFLKEMQLYWTAGHTESNWWGFNQIQALFRFISEITIMKHILTRALQSLDYVRELRVFSITFCYAFRNVRI